MNNQRKYFEQLSELMPVFESEFTDITKKYIKETAMPFSYNQEYAKRNAVLRLMEDLEYFTDDDPAANENCFIAKESRAFMAVRYYRYISSIINSIPEDDINDYVRIIARKIAEESKIETSIDIHPFAKIGKYFMIDHGVKAIIGERCIIGDYFHLMQNIYINDEYEDIILGVNSSIKVDRKDRHPKIGNYVTIYGGARVLGNIKIGDNCIIGTNCVVTTDIPDNFNVSITNQLQLTRINSKIKANAIITRKTILYGIIPINENTILISGENLDNVQIELFSMDTFRKKINKIIELNVEILSQANDCITLSIYGKTSEKISIRLFEESSDGIINEILVLNSQSFNKLNLKGGIN